VEEIQAIEEATSEEEVVDEANLDHSKCG